MNKTREEKIKNDKLKELLLEKEGLIGEKNELLKQHDEFRKKFSEDMNAVKEKLNTNLEKVLEEAKNINIITEEFEELQSVKVEDDNVVVVVVDKIEEFKEDYLKAKEEMKNKDNKIEDKTS